MAKFVFCLPGRSFSNNFLASWTETVTEMQKEGHEVRLSMAQDSNVYYVRQKCVGASVLNGKRQKPWQLQDMTLPQGYREAMDYDYMMWIDSDVVWRYSQIKMLIQDNKPIVSGLYIMEGNKAFTAVIDWDENFYRDRGAFHFVEPHELKKLPHLFKVAYIGFGFILIKKGVFEKLEYPWFRPIMYHFRGEVQDFCSEDVGWCRTATQHGLEIWIDKRVIVGHEKPVVLGTDLVRNSMSECERLTSTMR